MTGLGNAADFFLQIQHVEPRHAVLADVAGMAADLLIAAGAEREVARAGQDDHADLGILMGEVEGLQQFLHRLRAEGIAHFRPVDGDFGNFPLIGGFVTDVLEFTHGGPHGRDFEQIPRRPQPGKFGFSKTRAGFINPPKVTGSSLNIGSTSSVGSKSLNSI